MFHILCYVLLAWKVVLFWYFPLLCHFRDLKDNLWTYLPCCMTIILWMHTKTVLTSCRAQYLHNSMFIWRISIAPTFCFLSWLFGTHCFKIKPPVQSLFLTHVRLTIFFWILDRYVERVLYAEREKMKCCSIEYSLPKQSSQAFVYGGILLAGFLVYSLVIFFSSPVR